MKHILQCSDISVKYKERTILHNISLDIEHGDFIILIGANGSGKSTLMRILAGDIQPSVGRVWINKNNNRTILNEFSRKERALAIVTLTQQTDERLFVNLTVHENIVLWSSRLGYDKSYNDKVLNITGNPKKFFQLRNTQVRFLSGGEKQVLLLALVLAHPPAMLFLDEHTSSLDHRASREVMHNTSMAINNHKITAIMVTHQLQDVIDYGNRIIALKNGSIFIDKKKNTPLTIDELKNIIYQ